MQCRAPTARCRRSETQSTSRRRAVAASPCICCCQDQNPLLMTFRLYAHLPKMSCIELIFVTSFGTRIWISNFRWFTCNPCIQNCATTFPFLCCSLSRRPASNAFGLIYKWHPVARRTRTNGSLGRNAGRNNRILGLPF